MTMLSRKQSGESQVVIAEWQPGMFLLNIDVENSKSHP